MRLALTLISSSSFESLHYINNLLHDRSDQLRINLTANRRQGVGMKLVKIGLKVTEKWGDPKLFVVVESGNVGAIKMYEKLQFACVMKEEDNINRRMDKVPRIFMSIDVPIKRAAVADTVL